MKSREGNISRIVKLRKSKEKPVFDKKEVKINLIRIMNNEPLTRPLRALKKRCNFVQIYTNYFNRIKSNY